jgi:hypothetical protein
MEATQLFAVFQNTTNSSDEQPRDSRDMDFAAGVLFTIFCCFVFAACGMMGLLCHRAMVEHQRLLKEKGTTERVAIESKERVDMTAENAGGKAPEGSKPRWVYRLNYTVEVAGPSGERMKVKVTKQNVPFDCPAAAGLEEAETVEVMLLPSQPQLVNLKASATGEIEDATCFNILMVVGSQVVCLPLLCLFGSGWPLYWGIWFLSMFVVAYVSYTQRWKRMTVGGIMYSGDVAVTLMNTGAKEGLLA